MSQLERKIMTSRLSGYLICLDTSCQEKFPERMFQNEGWQPHGD